MNKPIIRIYMLVLVLFASLVYFTSKWAVFDAEELEAKDQNRRPLIEAQQIPRGSITTADGVLVAESNPEGGGAARLRPHLSGGRAVRPPGRLQLRRHRQQRDRGVRERPAHGRGERVRLDPRPAARPGLGGRRHHADDRLRAQRIATDGLQSAIASNALPEFGTGGAAVALDPSTGAVLAMASQPGYDPNTIDDRGSPSA